MYLIECQCLGRTSMAIIMNIHLYFLLMLPKYMGVLSFCTIEKLESLGTWTINAMMYILKTPYQIITDEAITLPGPSTDVDFIKEKNAKVREGAHLIL